MELPRLTHSYDTSWSPEEWQEFGAILSSCPLPSTQKSCPGNPMMVQDHGELHLDNPLPWLFSLVLPSSLLPLLLQKPSTDDFLQEALPDLLIEIVISSRLLEYPVYPSITPNSLC